MENCSQSAEKPCVVKRKPNKLHRERPRRRLIGKFACRNPTIPSLNLVDSEISEIIDSG